MHIGWHVVLYISHVRCTDGHVERFEWQSPNGNHCHVSAIIRTVCHVGTLPSELGKRL